MPDLPFKTAVSLTTFGDHKIPRSGYWLEGRLALRSTMMKTAQQRISPFIGHFIRFTNLNMHFVQNHFVTARGRRYFVSSRKRT